MSYQIVTTYEEACQAVQHWGLLPLSSFIPDHPSLEAITPREAWHTGLQSDPWLWRDRFAVEGTAAYGRFIAGKPLLVSRELFPLVACLLGSTKTVAERFQAGVLARSTLKIYGLIAEHDGIDVKTLKKLADMQDKGEKNAFDHALVDLQGSAEIVISGLADRLNEHGNKSGWNSTCYMLAPRWMEQAHIEAASLTPEAARAGLQDWSASRWEASAQAYIEKKTSQR